MFKVIVLLENFFGPTVSLISHTPKNAILSKKLAKCVYNWRTLFKFLTKLSTSYVIPKKTKSMNESWNFCVWQSLTWLFYNVYLHNIIELYLLNGGYFNHYQ